MLCREPLVRNSVSAASRLGRSPYSPATFHLPWLIAVPSLPPVTPDLDELVDLFYDNRDQLGRVTRVSSSDMPPVFGELLDHNSHMTVTVERHHGSPVEVQVLKTRRDDSHYSRKILLRRQSDQRVVQFGIVRLELASLAPEVLEEIQAEATPLGRILIQHQVMRQVQLAALWRIEPGPDLQRLLDCKPDDPVYGRTALIFCNDHPAVELLEVVVDV